MGQSGCQAPSHGSRIRTVKLFEVHVLQDAVGFEPVGPAARFACWALTWKCTAISPQAALLP